MANPAEVKQFKKIPPIDYTSRDFPSIKADLIRSIPFYTPEWTDFNESDLGIVLLDLIAHSADVLHFYLDRNANEAFLPTALTRRSVINQLKLIDYRMRSAVPASVDLVFNIPPLPGNLLIAKGTKVQSASDTTDGPVFFETVEDLTILAGQIEGTVGAVEGQAKEELLPQSDGRPDQRILLAGNPIIDGTIELIVDEGAGAETWVEVQSFIDAREDSKVFVIIRDENEVVTLLLGDNVQGKIPVAGSDMMARYRLGGGVRGNVGAETIVSVVTPITFLSSPVAVEVNNPLSASGGEERETIEEAKINGPRSLRALNRAVTAEDFAALAESFPGVAKAKVVTAPQPQPDIQLGCCCLVSIIVAPEGGGIPSSVLKADLLAFLEERKMIGTCIQILDPNYVKVDITGTVFVAGNFDVTATAADLAARVDAFFNLTGEFVDFGQQIFLSDIYRMVDETPGVDHADLTKMTRKPEAVLELWRPEDGATFGPIEPLKESLDEEWTVIFTTDTTFSLRDGAGVVLGTFPVGLAVPSAATGGRVSFTLSAGSIPMCPADRSVFRTSPLVGNVPIDEIEIPIKGDVNLSFVGGARAQLPVCR